MKIKNLTLNDLIQYAKEYKGNCTNCPLYSISELHCNELCDLGIDSVKQLEKDFEKEINISRKVKNIKYLTSHKTHRVGNCPTCKDDNLIFECQNYCPYCGTELDWSSNEENN